MAPNSGDSQVACSFKTETASGEAGAAESALNNGSDVGTGGGIGDSTKLRLNSHACQGAFRAADAGRRGEAPYSRRSYLNSRTVSESVFAFRISRFLSSQLPLTLVNPPISYSFMSFPSGPYASARITPPVFASIHDRTRV